MRTLIVSLIAMAALLCSESAHALRQVRVYEVNVSSQVDAAVQAQSGLRQVLVRATGSRDAANDPALGGVLANAQQYVIATRPAASGNATTLVFDANALERDITAAGRSIWPSERPLLLIVLTGGPATGAFETRRQVEGALDAASGRRGQPIRVARPEALNLPVVGDIPTDAALAAAQRLGADAVIIGYGDAVTTGGAWRWILAAQGGINESWNGALDDSVNGAADIFARTAQSFAALPEMTVLVEVEGVPGLKEYVRVAELLGAAGGVRGVQLAEAASNHATYAVLTRGGPDALLTALAANASFERIDPKAGGTIAFRFRP
jgi:Uncharacterized protein conserved in bacteria (DUF2066)